MGVAAMFLKTLRIFIIVKAGMRRKKVSAAHILFIMGVLYLFWVVYLALYSAFAPPIVIVTLTTAITGQVTETRECRRGTNGVDVILISAESLILLLSAILCYLTRDVPDAINEAQVIAGGKLFSLYKLLHIDFR